LIEVFKCFDNVNYTDFLKLSNTGRRGQQFKLYKPHVKLDIRNFFSVRVIDTWNYLPESLLKCTSVDTFK